MEEECIGKIQTVGKEKELDSGNSLEPLKATKSRTKPESCLRHCVVWTALLDAQPLMITTSTMFSTISDMNNL